MKRTHIIAYDVGTSSVKAALYNNEMRLLSSASKAYPVYEPEENFVEQEPEDYWKAICEVTKEVRKQANIDKECIKSIAFSCQSMGIIPVDDEGYVLHRNITWLDGRAIEEANLINSACGKETIGAKDVIPKLLWMKKNMAEIWDECKYILHVNGFLCMKCTGKMVSEITGAASYGLDLESLSWPKELFHLLGIDESKFPPLIKSTDLVGRLTEKAAEEMGLDTCVKVYGGCDDVQAAALGSGTNEKGSAHVYVGSSGWVSYITDKVYPMVNGTAITKSSDNSLNILVGVTQSVCITLNWLLNKFYSNGQDISPNDYEIMEKEIAEIPAGADKLIVTPWLFGEYAPIKDDNIRAGLFNINNNHTRAHFVKAVMESIGYNLKWIIDNYKDDYGIELKKVVIFGGGTKSDCWMQILADIFGLTVQVLNNQQYVGVMGAAACAVVGEDKSKHFSDVKEYISIKKCFVPNKENRMIYENNYEVFQSLYSITKNLSQKLHTATDAN